MQIGFGILCSFQI